MSHLIHVLEFKKALTEKGVSCPIEQSKLLAEPFTRALIRRSYRLGGWTSEMDTKAWEMLDKWNKVSPIPAALIHKGAQVRIGALNGAMMNTGTLPCKKEFTSIVGDLDVGELPACNVLTDYLVRELEANRE
jgi:hypothetical protein